MTPPLLHHTVERAAARAPDRDAVRFAGAALTYGQLADRVGRLARVLTDRGASRGDRVGILANKGLHSAVAMHGIMQAGAAYVPLDPAAPIDRLVLIAKDCGITQLVSEPAKRGAVQAMIDAGVPLHTVIGFDEQSSASEPGVSWEEVQSAPLLSEVAGATDTDVSYILYTSGSTGMPKGVVHTHRSALAFAEVAAQTFGLRADDRLTNHAPLHFDLSTLDYFAAAVAGATTVVVPEAYTRLPASLATLLERERVTLLYAVPLALTQVLLYGALAERDLSHLRWLVFAGEPFAPKHLRALMHALPSARFANFYGPTEVNGVTAYVVPSIESVTDDPVPIGHPLANVDVMIVDEHGDRVAPGEIGELWVRTPTMMRGYWGRPDLDAPAFAEHHVVGHGDVVFHRTGDLMRQDADGALHFFGRKDRQIKTRGYRVELDEVESAVLSHAGVEAAAVFGVPDVMGSTTIEATVVLVPGSAASASDLLAHASRVLPRYALPEHIGIVDALPRTASGKIDRVALRASALVRRTSAVAGAP